MYYFFVFLLTLLCVGAAPYQRLILNDSWRYHRGDTSLESDSSSWEKISLPHTYKLASLNLDDSPDTPHQETYHRDLSWYHRELAVDFTPGQRIFLEFEGAHQITDLWVDGKHVGQHAIGGYTPFHFDITDFVSPGKKALLALRLDNRKNAEVPPDGFKADFVLYGGLYRDVYLVVKNPLHIPFPWEARESGVMITTPSVSKNNGTVLIRTTVKNTGATTEYQIRHRIIDAADRVVTTLLSETVPHSGGNLTTLKSAIIKGEDFHLWSTKSPYLYRIRTEVLSDGKVIDHQENPLGFRWFELRPGGGFFLNGEPLELIGVNRHQHYPYLGDALSNNLHRLDAIKMKEAGLNIVRLAHYPHDNSFIEACDELGLIVAEEAPSWIHYGPPIWMDRLEEATRIMIRNHRNHPSLWGWAGGINHRGPVERLHLACKEEDPHRITMNNGTLWTGPQHSGVTDLYSVMDYRGAKVPPGGFLFGMEHSGSSNVTGQQRLIARYKRDPNRIGLTAWSGQDGYSFMKRGKKRPNISAWTAALWDIFRQPKPPFFWYQTELLDSPLVHIPDARAQKKGELRVFTNCDEVELFLDNESQGRQKPSPDDAYEGLNSPPVVFPIDGTGKSVRVLAYRAGKEVAAHERRLPGTATRVQLSIDEAGFTHQADGSSVLFAIADLVDQNGTRVSTDTREIKFAIEGPAQLVDAPHIKAHTQAAENGRAVIFFRVSQEPGTITLHAKATDLVDGRASVTTKAFSSDTYSHERPFTEPLRVKLDLGNEEQHIQDSWTPWTDSKESSAIPTISLSHTGVGKWTNVFGVPGDLSFMIEDGLELPAGEALTLHFKDLPQGKYRLRTWHHRLTGKRAEAPALTFTSSSKAQLPQNYLPSFGKKIQVSSAGGGNSGDGGSNLGAQGFAETIFEKAEKGNFTLTIQSAATGNKKARISLNGLELIQL